MAHSELVDIELTENLLSNSEWNDLDRLDEPPGVAPSPKLKL